MKLGASETLSNLQEIYSVHQINIAAASQEGIDTLKAATIAACSDVEPADTPNMYANMSHETQSNHTVSIAEQSMSADGVAMQPKFFAPNSSS